MRKIIRSKVYDTKESELIGYNYHGSFGDTEGYSEELYKNPEGFYFMHTKGGKLSPYPTENIKQVSAPNAEKWLKKNNKA